MSAPGVIFRMKREDFERHQDALDAVMLRGNQPDIESLFSWALALEDFLQDLTPMASFLEE